MNAKIIVLVVIIGLCLPLVAMATSNQLSPEVPRYNQDEFNNHIFYNGQIVDGNDDCVPTSVGMVFGYYYSEYQAASSLIPNPNSISGDLADWSLNSVGIKQLVQYSDCELNSNCQSGPYSLSEWVDYSYGQLGYVGTRSGDLCHKIRQAITEYDATFSLMVSFDEINTIMNNKDEIVARIKSEIDNGNPVMFYATEGMKFDFISSTTPTPDSLMYPMKTLNSQHAMVITGYNGNVFRLNFGYDNPNEEPEIIIDANNNFGYLPYQETLALVFFFTMGETPGVGLWPNNEWTYGGAGGSQNFVNAYVKFGGVNSIGLVSSQSPYVCQRVNDVDVMYIQKFINSLSEDIYLVSSEWNDWCYVFPVHGQILNYWLAYSGYFLYGAPMEAEHNEVDSNGKAIVVQRFQKGSTVSYIGYCSEEAWLGEYTYENGQYIPNINVQNSGAAPLIENIISMTAVPSYICNGVDAYAYLGSSPDTEQPVVSIINPLNSSEMKNIIFLNSNARPKFFTILSDMNGNGAPEIHLTAYDVTNLGKLVEIRDSKTGAIIQ